MGKAGVLSATILLLSTIIFLKFFNLKLTGFFLANILAQAIPSVYMFFKLNMCRYLKTFRIDKALEKQMLKFCIPLIFTVVAWWVNSSFDKYIVTFMCGIAANGILSVAYKIPSILNVLQGIFIQAWQITAIKEYGKDDVSKFHGDMFVYINLFMCIACSCLILLIKPIANIIYRDEFFIAWNYVPFLLIASVLNCASGFLGPLLCDRKDSKSMATSAMYGMSINIILNVILIHYIGIQGATIATVILSLVIYAVRKNQEVNS